MEKLTVREKLGVTLAASALVSGAMMGWGCPGVFFGWTIPAILGAWTAMTAVMTSGVISVVLLSRIIAGIHGIAFRREIRREIQLCGRDWRYIHPVGGFGHDYR